MSRLLDISANFPLQAIAYFRKFTHNIIGQTQGSTAPSYNSRVAINYLRTIISLKDQNGRAASFASLQVYGLDGEELGEEKLSEPKLITLGFSDSNGAFAKTTPLYGEYRFSAIMVVFEILGVKEKRVYPVRGNHLRLDLIIN